MPDRNIGRVIVGFFLRGLLLVVPVAGIIWASLYVLNLVDGIIPVGIPGLGILILVVSITLIGWLGSTILYAPLANLGEDVLQRIPFLKTIYAALKDLMEALVGNKKKFDQPVLVRMIKGAEIEKLGFLTQNDLSLLGIPGNKVAVYLPHSFAWSGNLYIVPAENVIPINASAGDVMKFIVSGGVAQMDDDDHAHK
ncbi:MAG: DUF502 domain-containing protein [Flavobacteriales bacterium]